MIKHLRLLIMLCFVGLVTASCGDNLFDGLENKHSSEADSAELDFAYIQGNCQEVKDLLKPKIESSDYTTDDLYMYNCAVLACSGFNVVKSFDALFNSDVSSSDIPFVALQSIMGVDEIDKKKSKKLAKAYNEVLDSCQDPIHTNDNTKIICGMTASAKTILDIGDLVRVFTNQDSVTITKDGITGAMKGIDLMTVLLPLLMGGTIPIDMDEMNNNIDLIKVASEALNKEAGGNVSISDELDTFVDGLRDQNDPDKKITTLSLVMYMVSTFTSVKVP